MTNNYCLAGHETERLLFRKLSMDDFEAWTKLFNSDDVAIFLGMDPSLSARELTTFWFEKSFGRIEKKLGEMNAVVDKNSGQLIGQSGLLIQEIEGEKRLEISYSILPEFANQGFASEAAQACKKIAFELNWAEHLISVVEPNNIGSERVAIKNGMTLEKQITEEDKSPFNVFCIHKKDWLQSTRK